MGGRAEHWFARVDYEQALEDLRPRAVNYDPRQAHGPAWHVDMHRTALPAERPGEPEPGGSWDIARRLIEMYEPPVPELVRGVYRHHSPLQGRDMLLEARFHGLRFYMGVRVTSVHDETREDGTRVWGWAYDTLDGHLERGRMTYEVVKDQRTGAVDFVTFGRSQRAPTLGPVLDLGWRLFGRGTQVRFYRGCGQRMRRMVTDIRAGSAALPEPRVLDGLVVAPSDARTHVLDHVAVRRRHPG